MRRDPEDPRSTNATQRSPRERVDDTHLSPDLLGLASLVRPQGELEESLRGLARFAARVLEINACSIMLLKDEPELRRDDGDPLRLRVAVHHGDLPDAAYEMSVRLNQGIAGHVAATGQPLLVPDIRDSAFADAARDELGAPGGFLSVPVPVDDKVVGVLNASTSAGERVLTQSDLTLATVVALLVGRSIQVHHLEGLLRSNFVQFALARELEGTAEGTLSRITQEPERMSRILAASFYREMVNAGFGTDHIIGAATEILTVLSRELGNRQQQRQAPSTPDHDEEAPWEP